MKDSEFIELLNLYVDHEMSAEQAARLEAEVTGSPERRKLYRQYCMMHKGCSLLSGSFVESASVPAGRRDRSAEARRFWGWSGIFAASGLLAAACMVLVVTVRNRGTAGQDALRAPALAAAAPTTGELKVVLTAEHPVNFPSPFGSGELQTVFNTRAWSAPVVVPVALAPNDPLAWVDQVRLTPLDRDGFQQAPVNFKTVPMLLPSNPAAVPVGLAPEPPVDRAAFQFQR